MKKILSLLLAVCTACTCMPCAQMRAETQTIYEDYTPDGIMPENMIPKGNYKSNARFVGGAGRNSTSVSCGIEGNFISEIGGWEDKIISTNAVTTGNVSGFEGTVIKNKAYVDNVLRVEYPDFCFTNEKSYVIAARFKQNAGEHARLGVSLSNETPASTSYTKEYGAEGMSLTGEYQDFKGTIKPGNGYSGDIDRTHSMVIGFPTGTAAGVIAAVDTSRVDAVYLAEEIPYDITNVRVGADTAVGIGDSVEFRAEVLNQIGLTGYLDQSVSWHILNADRTEEMSGFVLTPVDGAGISVCVTEAAVSGRYAVVAYSDSYAMAKGVEIEVDTNTQNIYVDAQNGSDNASGKKNSPLKSVYGAAERVKSLKQQNSAAAYNVIFAGGDYYIDDTISLGADCSGTAAAPVTFKAAEGEKVSFKGSRKVMLSQASPVTDKSILKRLYPEVRDKVVEIDLSEQTDMSGEPRHYLPAGTLLHKYEYTDLYLNGEEQPLAQWPNGEGNYVRFVAAMSENSFKYSGTTAPSRWSEAKDWWVGGYLIFDYFYTRHYAEDVDAKNRTINLETFTSSQYFLGQSTNISKRWKAYNLLEEIDVPGEWYIDKDTMTLYYYMPDTEAEYLEISVLKKEMFDISNAQYISFEGIEFTQTRATAVNITDSRAINFYGCRFTNLSSHAIYTKGTEQAQTDKDYWQRQTLDAAYDCTIKGCIFDNVGGMAARLDGGNVDTLTPGNNVFENNIVYRCAQKAKNNDAISVNGCGNVVAHNNISRLPFQAVRTMGNDHKISYNEIYNVIQETDDCGAVYSGRNTLARGVEISYNYMHDLNSIEPLPRQFQMGIYWDDAQTGQYAHHNVFENANIDVYTAGTDNVFEYNTSIDIGKSLYFKDGGAAANTTESGSDFAGYIFDKQLYYDRYPNLQTVIENFNSESIAALAVLRGNLGVNCGAAADAGSRITRQDNVSLDVCDDFADAAHRDFRIKSGTETKKAAYGVLDDSFDIAQIGAGTQMSGFDSNFSLISPINGTVTDESLYFSWENAFGATCYTIEISKDSGFSDIVYCADVPYNYAYVSGLDENGKYYWRVKAINSSREYAFVKQSAAEFFCIGERFEVSGFAAAENGQGLEISANITAMRDGDEADAYIAAYNATGELLGVNKKHISQEGVVFVRLPNDADCFRAAVFVWNENGEPLIGKKQIFTVD